MLYRKSLQKKSLITQLHPYIKKKRKSHTNIQHIPQAIRDSNVFIDKGQFLNIQQNHTQKCQHEL